MGVWEHGWQRVVHRSVSSLGEMPELEAAIYRCDKAVAVGLPCRARGSGTN
jgi:hypothetical protein